MRRLARTTASALIVSLVSVFADGAQTPASSSFEVASVKPNTSSEIISSFAFQPGGRFTATNVTLRELIRAAYVIQNAQLDGGPAWIGSERFDVAAKAATAQTASPMMLRALLAERFNLTTHSDVRELSVFELVIARSDRRLGPQLRQSQVDCAAMMAAVPIQVAPRPALSNPGARQACDTFVGVPPLFAADGVSMAQLATSLSRVVARTVVDRTGLTGLFDFELQWTPEVPQRPTSIFRLNGIDVDPDGPSIFTALQEQLGLKLESRAGPVQILVIDHVERPTED
jgi:uncharacterized protein (TIGR03435 family)